MEVVIRIIPGINHRTPNILLAVEFNGMIAFPLISFIGAKSNALTNPNAWINPCSTNIIANKTLTIITFYH